MSDSPFSSREVRWFLAGAPSAHGDLVDWFSYSDFDGGAGRPGRPEWRGRLGGEPDLYLLVPGADDVGIKWREGLLQIKGRAGTLGPATYGPHAGVAERWLKWSYADLPSAWRGLFASDASGRRTVAVHKQRLLRLLRIDDRGTTIECDPDTRVARGINVELTDVSVAGERFVTLGFEAFPDDETVADVFDPVVSRTLESLTSRRLDPGQSKSYPGWLANGPH